MKRFFTLLCILIATGAFAERFTTHPLILQTTDVKPLAPSRGVPLGIGVADTLFWAVGDGSAPALYRIPDPFTPGDVAGYIAGTDQLNSAIYAGFEDGNFVSEDAQIFGNTEHVKVIGAKFCFGAKQYVSGDPTSRMLFRMYRNDSTYVNANSDTVSGPGTLLVEIAVRLDSIHILQQGLETLYTGSQNVIFPNPIYVDSGFTMSICIDSLNALDTIGMFTSELGLPHPPDMSLVKFVGAGWANYGDTLNGWGYDLDLAIFPIIDFTQYDTMSVNTCIGTPYTFNNIGLTRSGTYADTVLEEGTTYLYDSLVVLNLAVGPDTTVFLSGDSLFTANVTSGASYQWIDCSTQLPIGGGDTLSTFKPVNPGNYALQITQNGCIGTSSCYAALVNGVRNLQQLQFKIQPNPTHDICTIYPGDVHGAWNGSLYNIQGQLIQNLFTSQPMQPYTFSTSSLAQGIYLIKVNTEDGNTGVQKLVIE